jgi:hypothetical protein
MNMTFNPIPMIEQFQCPGCVCGSDTSCGEFELNPMTDSCINHVPGTMVIPGGLIMLGLPKGFNKIGPINPLKQRTPIRFHAKGDDIGFWDKWNIPVWGMIKDGFLFIRTYCPRINTGYVDVFQTSESTTLPKGCLDISNWEMD